MPRALRIESNDGIYHIINRGNYRNSIFAEDGAKLAFERCLFESCERARWGLFGYCLMDNHFHLCISTPKGNLSEGMRWLQSTFAARYNRFRKEKGHLFQGRFKSLLVEPGKHLTDLLDYIHLNPARAGIAEVAVLNQYRWSSLYWFPKKKSRPSCLDASWSAFRDGLSDSSVGWRGYMQALRMRVSVDPEEIDRLERRMCQGWCIGDPAFKQAMAGEFLANADSLLIGKEGLRDLNESHWAKALEKCLDALKQTPKSAAEARFSAEWKLAIATKLKEETSVKNAWLSERLSMGAPRGVSSNCGIYAKRKNECPHYSKLADLTFDD